MNSQSTEANLRQFDPWIYLLAGLATIIGATVILDAGYARSMAQGAGPIPREFVSQLMFIGIAAFCALAARLLRLEVVRALASPIFWLSFLALIAVEVFGTSMNGAQRWLTFGKVSVQPAELAKVTVIFYLAAALAQKPKPASGRPPRNWAEWLDKVLVPLIVRARPLLFVLAAVLLIEREPDLGTAAVIFFTAVAMLFIGGVSKRSLAMLAAVSLIGITVMTISEPYRLRRIVEHSQRWDQLVRDEGGYQTVQSETAMAGGGAFGVGIGAGRAKHLMPAATTDFILATIGEEFGLVGVLLVLGVLTALTLRLFEHARRATSRFAGLVLGGTAIWIGIQTCTNVLMANGTLPPIGIPLPFISSGGSSLVALWIALGVCQVAIAHRGTKEGSPAPDRNGWRHRRARLSGA